LWLNSNNYGFLTAWRVTHKQNAFVWVTLKQKHLSVGNSVTVSNFLWVTFNKNNFLWVTLKQSDFLWVTLKPKQPNVGNFKPKQ